MVLGSGLVARSFNSYKNDDSCLIFASGVSNSATINTTAFQREEKLLNQAIEENQEKIFVYFSTCSLYDSSMKNSPYVKHKLAMEELIKEQHNSYYIFRISNLAGRTSNPHTVLNYFYQHIKRNQFFYLWKNASRNIIDVDDAVSVCNYIIKHQLLRNEIVNIANPQNYPVVEIVKLFEEILNKKGNYSFIDKGGNPEIDTANIEYIFLKLDICFDEHYLFKTIKKYYPANDL